MQPTFFFYDLETSGIDPKRQRIMQFAGQRTTMDLELIDEPINILVALSDDVLPDPQAILVTGITPQKTQAEGYTEAEFLKILQAQVFTPGTIITGFNSVRFDDEFMRYTLYRNFYDPYEWQWKDKSSRWDVLDVVRMVRALRPEGITWPTDATGAPTNRLELITSNNGLDHENAHDALSDVMALIDVARLLKKKQPKMFEYLLNMRTKGAVQQLVNLDDPQPFVYTSGRYPKEQAHTTVAIPIAPGGTPGSVIVYDLRQDPALYANKTIQQLKECRFATRQQRQAPDFLGLPAKELAYNRCPAVAPMGVLDVDSQARLDLDLATIQKNLALLRQSGLVDKLREVFARGAFPKTPDVDAQLYDSFLPDMDKAKLGAVRAADATALVDFHPDFIDQRLPELLLRYKARNFPASLADDERTAWEVYRTQRLLADMPKFAKNLQQLMTATSDENQQFLLGELRLWAESVVPSGVE